jgi:hypothetical protein
MIRINTKIKIDNGYKESKNRGVMGLETEGKG